ncbi:hypothetical protein RN001_008803 [Aquatica leii]|uniref:Mutator-like transposase domain-containing protein n=1 Tax=Aquatica leii TaxID=1421715 RepID=A0AAN7PZH6_9COLE|nr:hypothetical protein RN001_008803 [Aquatica leii]
MCNATSSLQSDKNENQMDVNLASVLGATTIGCGYSQMEQLTSILNIPSISQHHYNKKHSNLEQIVDNVLIEQLKLAGQEEARLALENGNVDGDGVPCITSPPIPQSMSKKITQLSKRTTNCKVLGENQESSGSSDKDMSLHSSGDSLEDVDFAEEESNNNLGEDNGVNVRDFALVRLQGKKAQHFYVVEVLKREFEATAKQGYFVLFSVDFSIYNVE